MSLNVYIALATKKKNKNTTINCSERSTYSSTADDANRSLGTSSYSTTRDD